MSRKTIPLLMVSIAVLLTALIIIIAVMLSAPDLRLARERRSLAVKTLLSGNSGAESLNLNRIALSISEPLRSGGSLDNLYHFLSKDPGRSDFAGSSDRRKAGEYLDGRTGVQADLYISSLRNTGLPVWAPEYVGIVRALFEVVGNDILKITGIPPELTSLTPPETDEISATSKTENAIGYFASQWIPRGETATSYLTDRRKIRAFLMGSRRFKQRIETLDSAWKNLAAALYNLSTDPRWLTAVQYAPELETELKELTILVLSADIHRRGEDLMLQVRDLQQEPGVPLSPGIMWLPDFSYYKNIPELTGQTADDLPTIFFAKVNLGYTFRDSRTQTWLNRRKDWLSDYFSSFFSASRSEDFSPIEQSNKDLHDWKSARLKAEGIHRINSRIASDLQFGARGVYGVRDLALVRVNLLTNP